MYIDLSLPCYFPKIGSLFIPWALPLALPDSLILWISWSYTFFSVSKVSFGKFWSPNFVFMYFISSLSWKYFMFPLILKDRFATDISLDLRSFGARHLTPFTPGSPWPEGLCWEVNCAYDRISSVCNLFLFSKSF